MSLLKRVLNAFIPPLVVSMTPVEGGVRVSFHRQDRVMDRAAVQQMRVLPATVAETFQRARLLPDQSLLLSFPEARLAASVLRASPQNALELKVESIFQLHVVRPPDDFGVHWTLDSQRWTLRRELHGADLSLGGEWFKRGNEVWQLPLDMIPSASLALLDKPILSSLETVALLTEVMPRALQHHLPLTTDAEIAPVGKLRLEITKTLERALDVRLVANPPAILNAIHPMPNNPSYWVNGKFVFLDLGRIPARVLESLRTGQTVRVTGDDLPALIQDSLIPNVATFGVDVSVLAAYPMIDFALLKPHWELAYSLVRGVGSYRAVLCFARGQDSLTRESLRAKVRNGTRFMRAKQGWIVLPPDMVERLKEIDARFGEDFTLDHGEILGLPATRLTARNLSVPPLETLAPSSDSGQIVGVLNTLRMAGLPAGLIGFSDSILNILSAACGGLLAQHSGARILWVTPTTRQKTIRPMLEKTFRVKSANQTRDYSETGAIYLCEAFHEGLRLGGWTAILYENVDVVLSSTEIGRWSALPRDWTAFVISTFLVPSGNLGRDRANDLMRLVRLPPSAYDLFRQHAMQTALPSMPESDPVVSPARPTDPLTPHFKQIFLGDKDETKPTGLPIPKRPLFTTPDTSPTPVAPSARPQATKSAPVKQVFRPQFEAVVTGSSPESFVSQAKRYAKRGETQAEPVPFTHYWPTYADMTPDQQRWYFYWRSQGRLGNWLPTDLSYLFVHIYEALNLIGFESAQEASDHLIRFWRHYRRLQPRLDAYLIDWIADLSALFRLPLTPLRWIMKAMQEGVVTRDAGLMFEAWCQAGQAVEAMPLTLLFTLAGYNAASSKFYQQHNVNGSLDAAFLKSIAALDHAQREKTGVGLFELAPSPQPREIRREPFANAPHDYPRTPLLIAQIQAEPENQPQLAAQLSSAIKYTENILRTSAGFKGKLRGIDLPDGWAAIIERAQTLTPPTQEITDQEALTDDTPDAGYTPIVPQAPVQSAIPPPPPPQPVRPSRPEIALDLSRIERLKRDSAEVRAMLTVPDEEPTPLPVASQPPEVRPAEPVSAGYVPIRPVDAPDGLLTDLPTVYQLMGSDHDNPARLLIATLRQADWKATPTTLQGSLGAVFVSTVIDQINDGAQTLLGDFLLFEEAGQWLLADDFRDEAEYLLDHAYSAPLSPSPEYALLGEGWSNFAQSLEPVHWRILEALLTGTSVPETIAREAQAAHTLPSVLIETINDQALDHTGDLIMDTMVEPPVLIADAIDSVRQLMAWAVNQPALLR